MGLYDAILIKENHIALAGGLEVAVERARAAGIAVEVECRDLDEVGRAIAAGAERILLDNMDPAGAARGGGAARAPARRRRSRPRGASTSPTCARWRRPGSS